MSKYKQQASQALKELETSLMAIDEESLSTLVKELTQAQQIAVYGVGREGLMMKALTMRLFHLGMNVHFVGDMTTPALGKGDLLLVSAGPGYFSTVHSLVSIAKSAHAKTICFTASADGEVPQMCDQMVILPAQTMKNDTKATNSILPMGSLYEGVQYLFYELLVLHLRTSMGETPESMRNRHTNLE